MNIRSIDLQIEPFEPYAGCRSGHLQTILGHIVPSVKTPENLIYQKLDLPDGDQVSVSYSENVGHLVVLVSHGLGGGIHSDYMARTLQVGQQLGHTVVLISQRGSDSKARAEKSYHSGRGEDYSEVVRWARDKWPNKKIVAVGFSMSGSILLNLLTGRRGQHKPDFGIVVNAPLDLKSAAYKLTKGLNQIYDFRFYKILRPIVEKNLSIKMKPWGRTIDIDQIYTAPVNGFKDRDDYYEQCSAYPYLEQIKTPTFVLISKDDPFIDYRDYVKSPWTDQVNVVVQDSGGHMGYFSHRQQSPFGRRWLDLYLDTVLRKIATML